MHAERDYLRNVVFPALSERLESRRVHLEPIDLRWGVDTSDVEAAHSRELEVLKVCLAEVERSRPFLLGLIGDRYGWVPPAERMQAASDEMGIRFDAAGRSITDLEITFGALGSSAQTGRSYFYLRERLPYDQMSAEMATAFSDAHAATDGPEASRKLAELKARLEHEVPSQVRRYSAMWDPQHGRVVGLEAWGEQVFADLLAAIEDEAGPQPEHDSWLAEEQTALANFLESRTRTFVGRAALLDRLANHARSAGEPGIDTGICIVGKTGSGKSALLAALLTRLEADNKLLVLAHAAGVTPRSANVEFMLRRWIAQLKLSRGASDHADEPDSDQVEIVFRQELYAACAERRVVFVVDALDQFERTTRAQQLTWMPDQWPANARFIATSLPQPAAGAAAPRLGIAELTLPGLETDEATRLIEQVTGRYHRTLATALVARLLDKCDEAGQRASASPLWLTLAVETLNLLDGDDFARAAQLTGSPEQQLQQYLAQFVEDLPCDIEGLHDVWFAHAEGLFGKEDVKAFTTLIAGTRVGWREADLRHLVPLAGGGEWDALRFARLRRVFRGQVIASGPAGQWAFHHQSAVAAVHRRYSQDLAEVRALHQKMGTYLMQLAPDDPVRVSETVVHLIAGHAASALGAWLSANLTENERNGAALALADTIARERDPKDLLQWLQDIATDASRSRDERLRLCDLVHNNLYPRRQIQSTLVERSHILNVCEAGYRQLFDSDRSDMVALDRMASCGVERANLLYLLGSVESALQVFEYVGNFYAALCAAHPNDTEVKLDALHARRAMAEAHASNGSADAALNLAREILHELDHWPAPERQLHKVRHVQSLVLRLAGDQLSAFDADALDYYEKAHAIHEELYRLPDASVQRVRELAQSFGRLVVSLPALDRLAEGLEAAASAVAIGRVLTSHDPLNWSSVNELAGALRRHAELYSQNAQHAEAQTSAEEAVALHRALSTADPKNTLRASEAATSLAQLADVLQAAQRLDEAHDAMVEELKIRRQLHELAPTNIELRHRLSGSLRRLGLLHHECGASVRARPSLLDAARMLDELLVERPEQDNWRRELSFVRQTLGDIASDSNEFEDAAEQFAHAFSAHGALADRFPDDDHTVSVFAMIARRLGLIQLNLCNPEAPLAIYDAFRTRLEPHAMDAGNLVARRHISAMFGTIGHHHMAQGVPLEAARAFHALLQFYEALQESAPDNEPLLNLLGETLDDFSGALAAAGILADVVVARRRRLNVFAKLLELDNTSGERAIQCAEAQLDLSEALRANGDAETALAEAEHARNLLVQIKASGVGVSATLGERLLQALSNMPLLNERSNEDK